ncbi:hypothetical protein [Peribacillus frigoritolerans]|uniref:hypothetical protein n=1 Tax=Peribacillus frigoritolerans TaxID=450367 RepID=UPI002ECB55A5|nr:hypothetical protein [Peribacillus frigoritolerans]
MTTANKFEVNFIHKDSYGTALEVVKKFVGQTFTRPILTYAFHAANGDVMATDSHRAIHIKDVHGFEKDYLVQPKSYMFATGSYPDLCTVMNKEKHALAITLNKNQIKLWLQLFKSMNNTLKVMKSSIRNKVVTFNFTENGVIAEVKIDAENTFETILPTQAFEVPNFKKISFSAEYMRDALEAHFKLNSEQLKMYFLTKMTPIILDDEAQVKTIILPVRNYAVED